MTIEEMQHKLLSLIDEKVELKNELEVYKKAIALMANDVFLDACKHKYDKCTHLFHYQIPCQECLECIINDYLQEVRAE